MSKTQIITTPGFKKIILPDQRILTSSMIEEMGQEEFESIINALSPEDSEEFFETMRYSIEFWQQEKQKEPDWDYKIWLVNAGRGVGKSWLGSNWIKRKALSGNYQYCNIVGATNKDIEEVMIEGPSGILQMCAKDEMPVYNRTRAQLTWPNGAITRSFSAEEPERIRGANHSCIWGDEVFIWNNSLEVFRQIKMSLRNGYSLKELYTSTPKKNELYKHLMKRIKDQESGLEKKTIHYTTGSTYENPHLPDEMKEEVRRQYEGTAFGDAEIHGIINETESGGIFYENIINENRVDEIPDGVYLEKVSVAIDPIVSDNEKSDEAGIIVGGLGSDGIVYILKDGSIRCSINEWVKLSVALFFKYQCDDIVYENNQGGDFVEVCIKKENEYIKVNKVFSSIGKKLRAGPVGQNYAMGLVKHVGYFEKLEEQMVEFTGNEKKSPDRMDALVILVTHLLGSTSSFKEWKRYYENKEKESKHSNDNNNFFENYDMEYSEDNEADMKAYDEIVKKYGASF